MEQPINSLQLDRQDNAQTMVKSKFRMALPANGFTSERRKMSEILG